jgi:SAM-dependent methyltransferase
MKFLLQKFRRKDTWAAEGNLRKRQYASYDAYLEHQKSKLSQIGNPERKRLSRVVPLRERFAAVPEIKRGMSVLCLGARHGGECEVLVELGAFAVGIDLNPGSGNPHVMTGDVHNIQFADDSIDCVFTNCLEHALEISRVIDEIKRVLKPGGLFICEIVLGSKDEQGRDPGKHDVIWWDHADTVVDRIVQAGFRETRRTNFSKPFRGVQFICSAPESPARSPSRRNDVTAEELA